MELTTTIKYFALLLICFFHFAISSRSVSTCPRPWYTLGKSCYLFTRSPKLTWLEANQFCENFGANLVSVHTISEHYLIVEVLKDIDPVHEKWFTSGSQTYKPGVFTWKDGSNIFNERPITLDTKLITDSGLYVAYNFSRPENRWGLTTIRELEKAAYICEISKKSAYLVKLKDIQIDFGVDETDPGKIPRGPRFTEEPQSQIFDLNGRDHLNYVTLRCAADAYPTANYEWFKENYNKTEIVSELVNPLSDPRYTQIDGTLIIHNPKKEIDRGKYHCKVSNQFGSIISETVQVSFGYIGQFQLTRSNDFANTNWGKSLSCDPPQHHPRGMFYWTKNVFPNIIGEDRRIFVSSDGNLYFSSVEEVDSANYSCNVQSAISSTGRTGPSFYLRVDPTPNSQKLQFPVGFPKIFPEAPLAGQRVSLECVAYGYPVPSYNWSRVGVTEQLPDGASLTSHNRLLIIPKVKVQDSGEYRCTAKSGGSMIQASAFLRVQSLPVFLQGLRDKVVDVGANLVWTCDAFGIPEVKYNWYKNGVELRANTIPPEDYQRIKIENNVLTIEAANPNRDAGMYQCRAYNELGNAFSSAQLKISGIKPTFRRYPLTDMYAAVGSKFSITCLPEALPAPSYQWLFNDSPYRSNSEILTFNQIRKEDEGWYICAVRNKYGRDQTKGYLTVFENPSFAEYPRPKLVAIVNDTVQLPCDANSDSKLDIAFIWLHNDIKINQYNSWKFSIGNKPGYLKIRGITFAEAGNYTCLVKSAVDTIAYSTELIVDGPPNAPGGVLADILNATSALLHWSDGASNGRRILSYKIEGRTNHNSSWIVLADDISATYVDRDNHRSNARVYNLSPWSVYEFRVSALNELGSGLPSDASPQYKTGESRPLRAPANVGGGGGKAGTLTITWDPLPPQDWNSPSIWYKIYWKLPNDYEYQTKELNQSQVGMYVIDVGENNYYEKYLVKVQAINRMGEGPVSEPKEVYSAESMPQVQPSLVTAFPFNSTSLNVSWAPLELTREKIRGKLIGHRIKYWRTGQDPQTDALTLLNRGTHNHGLIVALSPQTEYSVSVMAYNEAGSGPESEPAIARTFKAAPQRAPTNVKVKAIDSGYVQVTWRGVDASSDEEPINGYKVRYWESDQKIQSAKEVYKFLEDLSEDLNVIISGLIPGKTYKLRVLAYSSGGDGKMSSPAIEFKIGG
ncbi:contactin isoform X2 [Tetranychus urticae]|uniref:Contactin n=2 Tax=Tetranychus urticae TaxID=32264 RepID=T1KT78_TETUR|nr:contactin isoform X2 [Tetranychus urticae]